VNCIFFIGAGGSVPFGVPTMTEMVHGFEKWMAETHYGLKYVVDEIKNKLSDYKWYDIEALITVLQDIVNLKRTSAVLYNHPSLHFFTPVSSKTFVESIYTLGKRYHNEAIQILGDLKNFIVDRCEVKHHPFELYKELFSRCLQRYDFNYENELINAKKTQIGNEIFTTNYDLVLEAYCSNYNLDWEVGEKQGKLDISNSNNHLYGGAVHCVYKLHGSVNWYIDGNGNLRASSEPVKIGTMTSLGHKVVSELLVYPAFAKYTFREPFYSMFHHLKNRLCHCRMCCVVGYSFRDEDILGLFHDAMNINKLMYLVIIDPNADTIKNEIFPEHGDRVHPISQGFSLEAIKSIDDVKA